MAAGRLLLAGALLAGVGVDALLADPRRGHPVAGFGRFATWLERRCWRPARLAGAVHLACSVLPVTLAAGRLDRALTTRPFARAGFRAALTWTVLGAAGLRRAALAVESAVAAGDLDGARRLLPALCGRDAAGLSAAALRRAVVESVAENTSDAAVAPLVWGVLAGPAGLAGYRALNTLDAMVGHHSLRYERFGWAAARLDDLVNVVPARLTGLLTAALAGSVGGSPRASVRAWRRDAGGHPSPNAGVCEAAFAGALGLRLGGPTGYSYGLSQRPWLGSGGSPDGADLVRAVVLSRRVVTAAALLCAAAAAVVAR
jgi:adenosylcobinamide-phosphate synthase